jgi:bifunctional DNA-binding transcriptional regulator/antitoxin component of YhaV-PrlF toxin-antitoxin module
MSEVFDITMGKQGLLAIPAELQLSLGLHEGDKLVAHQEDGRLVLEKREVIAQRLKSLLAHLPKDRSLADELIAERREAAKKEAEH